MTFSYKTAGITLALLTAVFAACAAFLPQGSHAAAPGTTPITGWGWSDTIGWISFDCSDVGVCGTNSYGVGVDGSGNLSGYAWSDSIGWVSANAAELAGCPSAPCAATLVDGVLSGWLKATAAAGDGWDGWIRLKGANYGPTVADGVFSGYAWGSDVVGWVDFSRVRTEYLTDVCPNIGGMQTEVPPGYGLSGGICVACNYTCPTQTSVHNSCTGVTTVCSGGYICSPGFSICVPPPISFGIGGHLKAVPNLVRSGSATKLYWEVENVASCSVSGGGQVWDTASSGAGGKTTSAITQATVYTLSCTGLSGSVIEESVTVRIVPGWRER